MKILAFLLILSLFANPAEKTAYMARPGVAVFEPENFDATQHLPSPVFISEPGRNGEVPADWKVMPHFSRSMGKSVASFDFADADLYGAGEVLGNLRRNDDKQFFWNTDNPSYMLAKGKKLYQSHPWILGVRKDGSAFGIIADNTWKSTLTTKKKIRFESEGPAFRVIVIEKENPEEVLKTLAELSGKMELPPLWSLGYQQCRYSYYPQARVCEVADTMRSHRIPCDVIWMDIHYMDQYRIFTFSPKDFPDPDGLNNYLHEKKFKSVYMIDPGVKAEEGYFVDDQGRAGDFFVKDKRGRTFVGPVWPGDCHFPDFTNPDVRKWWSGLYKDFMARGVDGVWNDMNEPSVFVGFGGTMPTTNLHKGGDGLPAGTHLRYHNIYGYNMVKASREGIMAANPDKRPFILSRSNFLGGQRFAATWTGDNFSDYSQMKAAIPMTLNMGLTGQAFNGPDIGGFMRDCSPELLRQWTACGVYFPFVRNHSTLDSVNQEPFAFDKETEDVCRTAIERRYRLLPYIYTLFEESSRTGLPVMRPIFWADFKDTHLRGEQQAFLLGNDLMVIPRWSQSLSLPEGDWDLFSFEDKDDGYQSYLALRPGAALPVTGVFQNTVDYCTDSLTVLINPDAAGKAEGTLYEDAGDGYGYKKGEFARYELSGKVENGQLILSLTQTEGLMNKDGRVIRIGQVHDGKISYSEWSSSASVSMPYITDDVSSKVSDGLDFVYVKDFSVSKPQTKMELIMSNIVPKKKDK